MQQRVWLAWIRTSLRLDYELNRELQDDSGLSWSDYNVLIAVEQRAISPCGVWLAAELVG